MRPVKQKYKQASIQAGSQGAREVGSRQPCRQAASQSGRQTANTQPARQAVM